MALRDYIERIKRIDQLIRMQATGTPKELAKKLNISKSTVHEYINLMKELDAKIEYCKEVKSYVYCPNGKLIIEWKVKELSENQKNNINGGYFQKKSFFFMSPMTSDYDLFSLQRIQKLNLLKTG